MIDYAIHTGTQDVIDPMGSAIINVNATGTPNYQWVNVNRIKAYGTPAQTRLQTYLPFTNTVSYRIKDLHNIPAYNTPTSFVGDAVCFNSGPAACSGRGPFYINSQKYYIDFIFLYFVNTGTEPLYSPVFSVDTSKCDDDYGIFIGAPMVPSGATATNLGQYPLLNRSSYEYSNDLGVLNSTIWYKLTTVDDDGNNQMVQLTVPNVVSMVEATARGGAGSPTGGQTSVVASGPSGEPVVLQPYLTSDQYYYPFILVRYIAENAPTRNINMNFSFAPYVQ